MAHIYVPTSAALAADDWPAQGAICLDCRTVVGAGASCGQHGHHTADLASRHGQEQLIHGRWDRTLDAAPSLGAVGRYAAAGVLGALCAGLFLGLLGSESPVLALAGLLGIAALAPAAVLMALKRVSMRSFRSSEQRPLGAIAPPPLLLDGKALTGVIVAGETSTAPASGRGCVAYSVGLHHGSARPSTLIAREASCRSFTVQCDDGSRVLMPAGSLVLHGTTDVVDLDPQRLRRYLTRLGLIGVRGERIIEIDEVRELRLSIGDRVAVFGDLRSELDPNGPGSYREPAAVRWIPVGTPQVERLRPRS